MIYKTYCPKCRRKKGTQLIILNPRYIALICCSGCGSLLLEYPWEKYFMYYRDNKEYHRGGVLVREELNER